MKKIFFIFLLAVIGLTAKSFGQGTCSNAQQIYITDSIQSQTLQINDSVYWIKFTASDTTLYFYLIRSDTNVISNIYLYHANDGCDSYTNIDQDFGYGYINYENLIINDIYFIKITQNNTLNYNIYYSNKQVEPPISLGASLASVVTFNNFSPTTYTTYYNNITCWTSNQQDNCELIKVCTNVNFYIKVAAPSTYFVLPKYPFRYEFTNATTGAIFYVPSNPTSVTTNNITEPISLSIATPGKYWVKLLSYNPNQTGIIMKYILQLKKSHQILVA